MKLILIIALLVPTVIAADDAVQKEELTESDRILMQEMKASQAQLGGFDFSSFVELAPAPEVKKEKVRARELGPEE